MQAEGRDKEKTERKENSVFHLGKKRDRHNGFAMYYARNVRTRPVK